MVINRASLAFRSMRDLRRDLLFILFRDKFAINNARGIDTSGRKVEYSPRGGLTVDSSNIDLPARAVRVSLQLSVACKSTSYWPGRSQHPVLVPGIICIVRNTLRADSLSRTRQQMRTTPVLHVHTLVWDRESHGERTAGPREKCELFNSSGSIRDTTTLISDENFSRARTIHLSPLQDNPNLSNNTLNR